jgi:hypothetical protein
MPQLVRRHVFVRDEPDERCCMQIRRRWASDCVFSKMILYGRLLLLPLLSLTALAQTISFGLPKALVKAGAAAIQNCPACVAVADFNGDGRPDMLSTWERLCRWAVCFWATAPAHLD